MATAAGAGFSTATDLADWLVRELGLPFRDAHHITGAAVKRAEQLGCDLPALPLADLQALEPRITDGVYKVLTPAGFGGQPHELWRDRAGPGPRPDRALEGNPRMTLRPLARRRRRPVSWPPRSAAAASWARWKNPGP